MRKKIQVCEKCGFTEEIVLYSAEEARSMRVMLVAPCCKRCQSPKVRFKE